MAYKISSVTVINDSREIVNCTGINVNGTITATSFVGVFPAGTLMLFQQTSAPTGWTKQTTHNDKTLRVVSGNASSGGTTEFTSVFTSRTPAGTVTMNNAAFTLGINEIPAHNHIFCFDVTVGTTPNTTNAQQGVSCYAPRSSQNTGGSLSHTHANTATFSGTPLDFAVQYVDLIIASKD